MRKLVHVLIAVLTIPFGIGAYIVLQQAFAAFGFCLDATGIMVAKGFASTSLGFAWLTGSPAVSARHPSLGASCSLRWLLMRWRWR